MIAKRKGVVARRGLKEAWSTGAAALGSLGLVAVCIVYFFGQFASTASRQ